MPRERHGLFRCGALRPTVIAHRSMFGYRPPNILHAYNPNCNQVPLYRSCSRGCDGL